MILSYSIALGGLLIALWLTTMIIWWKKEQGTHEPLAKDVAANAFKKCTRYVRRGWYSVGMGAEITGMWIGRKSTKAFLSIFPSAAPAFAKKDELAGLKSGPTSFFLMTISEKEKVPKKTARKIFS